eukprot:6870173-Heterocapsa_arctica.AAC.1
MSRAADGTQDGAQEHPEVPKLRRLQQLEATEVLEGEAMESAIVVFSQEGASATGKSKSRKYTPTAHVLLPHCSVCGSTDHKRTSCPHKDLQGAGIPDRAL